VQSGRRDVRRPSYVRRRCRVPWRRPTLRGRHSAGAVARLGRVRSVDRSDTMRCCHAPPSPPQAAAALGSNVRALH